MNIFTELKRRNVFRVGMAYIVASWVFLQVADLVLDAINAPDWVLQAIMLLVALGFVASLIIAWAYELTPEGIKRDRDVRKGESITHETAIKLNRITIGLVVVAVVIVGIDRLVPERGMTTDPAKPAKGAETALAPTLPAKPESEADSNEKSVAVLPFVNMSSDPEQEFFSDGISEEILNVLTRIPSLKVAARTSSFQFKGQNLDIADIARQLKVNHVLEGSVRKAGNRVRVTAQLIEAQSGFHLWSDTFDRQLADIFAIQDEIAGAIASELRTRLSAGPLRKSIEVDLRAYEAYLKGRGLVATRKEVNLFTGIELLKSSIEIEPAYASAMATLAEAYVVLPWYTIRHPVGELREQARHWASRALEIEPDNAEAMAVLGVIFNEVDLEPTAALEILHQAVQASPGNLAANNFLGDIALRTWDLPTALKYESRAAELDPLSALHQAEVGQVYFMMGEYERAVEEADLALARDPTFLTAHNIKIDALYILGDLERLEAAFEAALTAATLQLSYQENFSITLDLARGDTATARRKLVDAFERAKAGAGLSPVNVAYIAAVVGDFDMAGEMLLQAHRENNGTWNYPAGIRLPEQAPDSEPWQAFWRLPGPARLAEIRRKNGMNPEAPGFGEGKAE